MKTIKRLFKNTKGIDTILAALLMVVIVVVASVMVYAWSTGLLGSLLVTPQAGKEAINIENSSFSTNSTVATLYLRNTGTASISLITYYVKDTANNQYSRTTWTGPTMSPNGLSTTYVSIGASCSACTLTGTAFTFTAGNSYTVTVITSRNNQFVFTIVR